MYYYEMMKNDAVI